MKNVSKLLLVVVLAGASYFFGMVVYGACSGPGGLICNTGEQCELVGGCNCGLGTVGYLGICTPDDPAMDGNRTDIYNGEVCGDPDGCNCDGVFKNKGETCTIVSSDITSPILSSLGVSVLNRSATFGFSCNEGPVTISCLGSCGSCSITANTGNNTITFSNLSNGVYNTCSIIGQDLAGNVSAPLNIPSFTINVIGGGSVGGGSVGGGGSLITTEPTFLSILSQIGVTETGFSNLLEIIKTEKSVVYEYTPQGVKIRIFVPKYKQWLIRKTILSLNNSLTKAINKKLLRVTDPSYMIENFENLNNDSKILVYKEIGAITHLYNEFLGVLYIVLDMKQRDYLPLAKYYLENYFKEFAKFQK